MTSGGLSGVTITSNWVRAFYIGVTLVVGFVIAGGVMSQHVFKLGRVLAVAYLVIAAAVIWSCSRAWRVRLHMDGHDLTVRNWFRTYRFGWTEVDYFIGGLVTLPGEGGQTWTLRIVLRDGRWVEAVATHGAAAPAKLTVIRQAAMDHGIPADLNAF
jgi:hypothetical protein